MSITNYTCKQCGKPFAAPNYKRRRTYCSRACSINNLATMKRTHLSKETKEKISQILRQKGIKPIIQGGNGRPLSEAHQKLLEALGSNYVSEYPIVTASYIGDQIAFPNCYKVDIALPDKKLAIEIDGNSHRAISRKAQDLKKEKILRGLGWNVIRFSNKEVLNSINTCLIIILYITKL